VLVSAESICGALCGYMLLGLAFGHLYCILESITPGAFHGDAEFAIQLRDQSRRHFLLTYFSFATLTTVGYGDITPVRDSARGLSVVEAILGQLYLAVLIAELIGKRVAQALSDRGASPQGTGAASRERVDGTTESERG
jgi:voltage-gated potassium channel